MSSNFNLMRRLEVQIGGKPMATSPSINKKDKANSFPVLPLVGAIAVVVIGVVGVRTWKTVDKSSPAKTINKTVVVEQVSLPITIEASGKVIPIQTVNLSPKVAGKLVELMVEQGDRVAQGQVIARMDATDIEPQILQAKANLASAKANLERLRNGNRIEDIKAAKAQMETAEARAVLTKKRLDRFQELSQEGVISNDRLDELATDADAAQATLEDRQRQLERLVNGSRAEDVAQAAAQVKEAEARLKATQVQLENTLIRAPFSGVINQKYTNVGAFVTPQTAASNTNSATSASIVSLSQGLEVRAEIPEVDIGQVSLGQAVEVVADAFPDQIYKGKVRLVAPEAIVEQNVTSFQVRIYLLTGQEKLRSGMNVELRLIGEVIPAAVVIPTVAIVTENGKNGVYIYQEGQKQPEFRPVTIGTTVKQRTQILSGLKAGERVFKELPEKRPGSA